jgi:hypothetical protein
MENETFVDIFLRTQEETRIEIVDFFCFLFECAEDFTFQLHMGKEI